MFRTLLLSLSLLPAAALAQPTPGQTAIQATTKQTIQALYNAENIAAARLDAKAVWKYRTPDFVGIDANGQKITAKVAIANTEALFAAAKSVQGTSKIIKFTQTGNEADVEVDETATVVLPDSRTGGTSEMRVQSKSQDKWKRVNGKWLRALSRTVTQKIQVDGRQVQ